MNEPSDRPWPGGLYGEVVSPSGRRAYRAARAAALVGYTTRWAVKLANGAVESEQGPAPAKGPRAWFLIADSFEDYLRGRHMWPPPPSPAEEAKTYWEELLRMQGADLDAAHEEIKQLKAALAQRNDQVAQLANIIAQLSTAERQ